MQEDRADRDPKSRPEADRLEYRVRRLEVRGRRSDRARAREEKEIDSEYGVYRSTERERR